MSTQSVHSTSRETGTLFSVIIPTLNEMENIGDCLSNILSMGQNVELIIVDGGSHDATAKVAEKLGAIVIRTESCRGLQCNHGAAIASGKILVFLHADTILPDKTFDKLAEIFSRNDIQIGNFGITFDAKHWFLKLLSFVARFDPGFFRFGDQGIVVRKSLFNELGGFYNWDLFEDMAFIRKARKKTKIHRLPMSVTTSARRFLRNGIIRQHLINVYYTLQYMLGIPPWKIAERYYDQKLNCNEVSLVIFLRLPESGKVKTRMARTMGRKAASQFYRDCTDHLLKEAEELPFNIVKYIYYTPGKNEEKVQSWAGPRFCYRPQVGGTLDKRLKAVFRDQFRKGMKKVIIVATDVPDLSSGDIEEAITALNESDVVIGPSTDGGYYLLGMNKFEPALFNEISWSSELVYEQTKAIASELGLKVHRLKYLDDIDTEDDLRRWTAKSRETDTRIVLAEKWSSG